MEKTKIRKILLLLSCLPYVIFLVMGIFNLCQTSIEEGYLYLYGLFEPLVDFWLYIIVDLNIVVIILTIFCVGYPINYFLDKTSKKKDNALEAQSKIKKTNKFFVLYMISFLPYLYLIYSCIFGLKFGLFFNNEVCYGFEAIILVLIFGSIIPIYPIILIFQIIYTKKNYKVFSSVQKKIFKTSITILLILLIVVPIIHLVISKNVLYTTYSEDNVIIENYLKDQFGEKYYNSMEIIEPDNISSTYKIQTSLLEQPFELSLNETRTEIISNSFYEDFVEENDLNVKLSNYLKQYYELPDYLEINSSIYYFDVKDSNNINKLLTNCSYQINYYEILTEYYNKEEIIEIIKDFFIKYDKTLNTDDFMFYVKINNQYYASIQAIKNEDGIIHLIFNGYNDGNGYTIQHEDLRINIYETFDNN